MNHHQDIDDGLDEYIEANTRSQDEAAYQNNPAIFSGDLGQAGDGDPFTCTRVLSLHLQGGRPERGAHPFAYDGGHALLAGNLKHKGPVEVTIRWDEGDRDVAIAWAK